MAIRRWNFSGRSKARVLRRRAIVRKQFGLRKFVRGLGRHYGKKYR